MQNFAEISIAERYQRYSSKDMPIFIEKLFDLYLLQGNL